MKKKLNKTPPLVVTFRCFLLVLFVLAIFLVTHMDCNNSTGRSTSKKPSKFIPRHDYLLFSNIGRRSNAAISSWLKHNSRNFDIVLYSFDNVNIDQHCLADHCHFLPDFKWPALYHFITSNNLDANSYKAVFAVDDDILMNTSDINVLFENFNQYSLIFAQPSYVGHLSDLHFPRIQRWRGNTILRYTNFVENAAMVIDFEILYTKLLHLLPISGSGWGTDYCFFKIVEPDIDQVATIHLAKAIHPPSITVTKASNVYGVTSSRLNKYGSLTTTDKEKSDNRVKGEALMKSCNAFLYAPKVFFRIKPGENFKLVIVKEQPNYPKYRSSYLIKSRW